MLSTVSDPGSVRPSGGRVAAFDSIHSRQWRPHRNVAPRVSPRPPKATTASCGTVVPHSCTDLCSWRLGPPAAFLAIEVAPALLWVFYAQMAVP